MVRSVAACAALVLLIAAVDSGAQTNGRARADAHRRAVDEAVDRLQALPAVRALPMKPGQLRMLAAAVVDVEDDARGRVVASVDADDAVRRMAALVRDADAMHDLALASADLDRLHGELAKASPQEQAGLVTAIQVRALTARAYGALARTEPATAGGRTIPAAGLEQAQRLAEAAMTLSPESAPALYLLGDVLVEIEQAQAAEVAYRKALAVRESSLGRTKLAAALRYQGDFPAAIAELREAQRLDPAFARAHSDLGMILREQRELPAAIVAYREAIRLDRDLADAHNGLAMTLANSGRMEDAVAAFREIVRIDPDSTIGYYNLAYALADLDRDVESAAALREVIRIYPDHYNARFNLGELFRLEGKYDDSANQFREYLRLAPDTPQNRRNITRARGYIQQFEDSNAAIVPEMMAPRGGK